MKSRRTEENKHSILSSSEQLGGFNAICMLSRLILISRMALAMRNSYELLPELFSENSSMLNPLGSISLTAACNGFNKWFYFVVRHFGWTALGSTSESTVELNYWG